MKNLGTKIQDLEVVTVVPYMVLIVEMPIPYRFRCQIPDTLSVVSSVRFIDIGNNRHWLINYEDIPSFRKESTYALCMVPSSMERVLGRICFHHILRQICF